MFLNFALLQYSTQNCPYNECYNALHCYNYFNILRYNILCDDKILPKWGKLLQKEFAP